MIINNLATLKVAIRNADGVYIRPSFRGFDSDLERHKQISREALLEFIEVYEGDIRSYARFGYAHFGKDYPNHLFIDTFMFHSIQNFINVKCGNTNYHNRRCEMNKTKTLKAVNWTNRCEGWHSDYLITTVKCTKGKIIFNHQTGDITYEICKDNPTSEDFYDLVSVASVGLPTRKYVYSYLMQEGREQEWGELIEGKRHFRNFDEIADRQYHFLLFHNYHIDEMVESLIAQEKRNVRN